jgi:hypothetical protein
MSHRLFTTLILIAGNITKRRISGDINGGGPTLTLRTSGGSVSIKKQP